MTTNEIKDLIASAIAGQGNQVDAGGKLAEILNALAEGAGGGGAPVKLTAPTLEDYGFLSQLRERINEGLLFNTTIVFSYRPHSGGLIGPEQTVEFLPVSFNENDQTVCIVKDTEQDYFVVPDYTKTQFEGIAAIQEAVGDPEHLVYLVTAADNPGGDTPEYKYLYDEGAGTYICVDGYLLEIGKSGAEGEEIVASVTKSNLQPVEGASFVNITMEDAQKLIGVPINRV